MGFSLVWYAVKGKAPEEVLRVFNLCRTGVFQSSDDAAKHCATTLPGGWFLLLQNHRDFNDSILQRLSRDAEVIACSVEEHVMVSKAAGWKDGNEQWYVLHDCQIEPEHLEARGQLPPQYASIRDRNLADQAAETDDCDHIFEIPVQTATSLTDFEHDAVRDDLTFEVLERASMFQRIFGR